MNITQEFVWVLAINWTLSGYFEAVNRWPPARDACLLGLFNALSFGEVVRSTAIVCLLYCLTFNCLAEPKTSYSWIFRDLSKFIYEPTCYLTFLKYLAKKEPARRHSSTECAALRKAVLLYLDDFRQTGASRPAGAEEGDPEAPVKLARERFLESLAKLQPSFCRFRKTVSFRTLQEVLTGSSNPGAKPKAIN